MVESGNGNSWRESLTPQSTKFPFGVPADIACSSGRCTIVGSLLYGFAQTSKFTSLIMTWNGHKLSTLRSLAVDGFRDSDLGGVTCAASGCWAVGESATQKISRTLIERS